jgi:arylsulfatase A-like enzyme
MKKEHISSGRNSRAGFAIGQSKSNVIFKLAALVFCAAALSGCARQGPANVLLITMDTTRADYIGCFGAKQSRTPNLDTLAADGAAFTNATTAAIPTTPSHTSILTSLHPIQHKVFNNNTRIPDAAITVQDILKSNGYTTSAFVSAVPVSALIGFNRGFDHFDDKFDPAMENAERRGNKTTDAALEWLGKNSGKPFFTWVHYYDPHSAYNPPDKYRNMFLNVDDALADCPKAITTPELAVNRMARKRNDPLRPEPEREFAVLRKSPVPGGACIMGFDEAAKVQKALYASEIAFMDDQIGRIIQFLKKKRLYGNTLIIAVADHGEVLDETGHGTNYAHNTLYEQVIRVPLIIKLPGRHPRRVVCVTPVSSLDITPTILDSLKIHAPKGGLGFSGISILGAAMKRKSDSHRPIYFESGGEEAAGVKLDGKKYVLVLSPRRQFRSGPGGIQVDQLFNLKSDPGEQNNLADSRSETGFVGLMRLLDGWKKKFSRKIVTGMPGSIRNREFGEKLKQLGYL